MIPKTKKLRQYCFKKYKQAKGTVVCFGCKYYKLCSSIGQMYMKWACLSTFNRLDQMILNYYSCDFSVIKIKDL
jgi:hypothetical protein